ncbi:MAG: hypothetical protein E4G94_06605 [ANME-2 cluster archaeon]|nr:MAG: hypothetical protein E4G94_06605 [ANME-2 cluster archaeon]
MTTPQVLTSKAAALLVGIVSGLVIGRRRNMLVTPAVFIIVFELARLGSDGFTVDAIHLGSTYGIIAFIVA